MNKILILIMILSLFHGAAYAEHLKFAHITDCHLSIDGTDTRGRNIGDSIQTLNAAVKSINNNNDISFVIFSGDNIDTANEENLTEFCKITKNINKPYYIAIGNHDVSKFQGLSKNKYYRVVKQYNKYQKSTDSYYYFFPNRNFIVIVMDGVHQIIPGTHGSYSEEDLAWLDKILTRYRNKKAIIIQHFPIVEPSKNKSHRTLESEAYMNILANHKNIIALVTGHYHTEKVTLKDDIYHISSPALVSTSHQYRIIEINYDGISTIDNRDFSLKTELIQLDPSEQK